MLQSAPCEAIQQRSRCGCCSALRSPISTPGCSLALPLAWAPILSIGGDFYELDAIAVSHAARTLGVDGRRWHGDDVVAVVGRTFDGAFGIGDAAGVTVSLLLGVVLAFATYAAGRALAHGPVGRRRPAAAH
ncbi:MAG: hypothetical protein ACREYB_11190 [Casimicrobiaceae bacterium]